MSIVRDPRRLAAVLGAGLLLGSAGEAAAQQPSARFTTRRTSARAVRTIPSNPRTKPIARDPRLQRMAQERPPVREPIAPPVRDDEPPPLVVQPTEGQIRDLLLPGGETNLSDDQLRSLDSELLDHARAIPDPSERSLALARIARSKVAGQELDQAQRALTEAGDSALLVPIPLVRDLRLMATVDGLMDLADAETREGLVDDTLRMGGGEREPVTADERLSRFRRAVDAYDRAAGLASRIERTAYESQTLLEIIEAEALDSQEIAFEAGRSRTTRDDLAGVAEELTSLADSLLIQAAEHAKLISLPVYYNTALVVVVRAAATSGQFERGETIAEIVPYPEARVDVFLRLAEGEVRRGSSEAATADYGKAFQAAASIPVADLRSTLASVIIDSLISSGRFEDARACVRLYPDANRKVRALGAVAEAMGRRGLSEQARQWITEEVPPAHQSAVLRRLNDGVLDSLNQYRMNVLSGRAGLP